MPRAKIAIIGGGPAGLSTAFHLTDDPTWCERLDVTVYQMGWRLGGKGATGRDAEHGWRLEEHGIHGFCRFYFNTFLMMERVFAELSPENRALLPVETMEDAFVGNSLTLGVEQVARKWSVRPSHLPRFPGVPWGEGASVRPEPSTIPRRILEQTLRRGRGGPLEQLDAVDLVAPGDESALPRATAIHRALEDAYAASEQAIDPARWTPLLAAIAPEIRALFARPALALATGAGDIRAYGALTSLDLYTTLLRGLIVDRILVPGRELDDFDGEDYRCWLDRHGASPETLGSSSLYTFANMFFAYPGGDCTQDPAFSAASWIGWILRTLTGRGDYFYLMAAGTGETVILPLYLLLKQRGVRFEFFHRMTHLESKQGEGDEFVVERLSFERQAQSIEAGYDPIDQPPPFDFGVWPNRPIIDQLKNPKNDRDYEAWDEESLEESVVLERGEHFDHVVWAIPPSMIPLVGDAALQDCWRRVIARLPTTATQAAQVWLHRATTDLGGPPCAHPERYATASFPNPLNGMVSFDDVLCFEGWGAAGPQGLFYLCGALAPVQPPTEATRPAERARVRSALFDTLDLIGNFFPTAVPVPPDPAHPTRIDFDLLYPLPGSNHQGPDRILDQYVRVNTRPTEAYVQSPRCSAGGRLDPWKCGYENLVPAGDWIYTGINVGAFESAVTGGKLAAFALTGVPAVDAIEAYDFLHPKARERAAHAVSTHRVPRIK